MALLLNRKYGSRLECLYYILQANFKNYGKNSFTMSNMKFDKDKVNITETCQLLCTKLNRKYCPYLENALNQSFCYATQSIYSDSTKSKAISDVVRSLEALGFIESIEKNSFIITDAGIKWIETPFNTKEWLIITRQAVLSYSLVLGFLTLSQEAGNIFNSSRIYLGYPNTSDPLNLSTGSTRDSNTRTVSKILSWCISTGLIEPTNNPNTEQILPQLYYRELVNASKLSQRSYKLTKYSLEYINSNPKVDNPLSYKHLNKNVGSIRENGSKTIRDLTIKYNNIILNRRFLLIYALNKASELKKDLSFEKLIIAMEKYYDNFFLPESDTFTIMQSEAAIATIAGIPFKINDESLSLVPQSTINESTLISGAPDDILNIANIIVGEIL